MLTAWLYGPQQMTGITPVSLCGIDGMYSDDNPATVHLPADSLHYTRARVCTQT